jgi:hypothetical protein
VKFDLEELIRVAESAADDGAKCGEVTRLPEGSFDKNLLVEMHDGRQLMINGSGGYIPSKFNKVAIIQDYGRVIPFLIPQDSLYTISML